MNQWIKLLLRPLAVGLGAALVVSIATPSRAQGETPGNPGEAAAAREGADLFQGIPEHGIALGNPDAPLTLVEFSDLQCPFCRMFAVSSLPTIVDRYVRPGKVRILFYNLPILGSDSDRAARTAVAAAEQDRLFPFVEIFFHRQGRERSGYVTDGFLRGIASDVRGLDVDRLMVDRDSQAVTDQLAEGRRMATDLHLHAVPTFLIGKTGGEMQRLNASPGLPETFTGPIDSLLQQD